MPYTIYSNQYIIIYIYIYKWTTPKSIQKQTHLNQYQGAPLPTIRAKPWSSGSAPGRGIVTGIQRRCAAGVGVVARKTPKRFFSPHVIGCRIAEGFPPWTVGKTNYGGCLPHDLTLENVLRHMLLQHVFQKRANGCIVNWSAWLTYPAPPNSEIPKGRL